MRGSPHTNSAPTTTQKGARHESQMVQRLRQAGAPHRRVRMPQPAADHSHTWLVADSMVVADRAGQVPDVQKQRHPDAVLIRASRRGWMENKEDASLFCLQVVREKKMRPLSVRQPTWLLPESSKFGIPFIKPS